MKLVMFDLDNTLLAGDSDVSWTRFLIDQGLVDREQYHTANERFYADYSAGKLDMQAYLEFALAPLTRFSLEELNRLHQQFMQGYIEPMMTPRARAEVARHKAEGAIVLIITATNRFVTAPIAEAFGVAHLIATEAELKDGRYTGKSFGTPCFQAGKIIRLEQWLAEQGKQWQDFSETWFYSDSRNDLPLLQKVSHPVAVNPDPVLKAHADNAGWPTLLWH